MQELNAIRDSSQVKEQIKFVEDCLKKTEQDLLSMQNMKSTEEEKNQLQLIEMEQQIKGLENQLESEKESRLKAENSLKEFEMTSDDLKEALIENEKLLKEADDIKEIINGKDQEIQQLQEKLKELDVFVAKFHAVEEILQKIVLQKEESNDVVNTVLRLIQLARKTESLEEEKLNLLTKKHPISRINSLIWRKQSVSSSRNFNKLKMKLKKNNWKYPVMRVKRKIYRNNSKLRRNLD